MRVIWNNIDNVFKDYLVSLNEAQAINIVSTIVENIETISKSAEEFYIGKTGDPNERMFGGLLSENIESLNTGHHLETGYKSLYLLLHSKNKTLVEAVESTLLKIFYNHPNNGNFSRLNEDELKNTGNYYIYVAIK